MNYIWLVDGVGWVGWLCWLFYWGLDWGLRFVSRDDWSWNLVMMFCWCSRAVTAGIFRGRRCPASAKVRSAGTGTALRRWAWRSGWGCTILYWPPLPPGCRQSTSSFFRPQRAGWLVRRRCCWGAAVGCLDIVGVWVIDLVCSWLFCLGL